MFFKTLIYCFLLGNIPLLVSAQTLPDLHEGDLVFQYIPSKLSTVIAEVSASPYSHVGLLVQHENKLQVLEAIGPVRYTPLHDWIEQGENGGVTIMRLKNENPEMIQKAIAAAKTYLGRPYDLQYELDDEKIYCSELVYKSFSSVGIEIGKKQALETLNWRPHRDYIMYLAHGELPLNRLLITPDSQFKDDDLVMVYSNMENVSENSDSATSPVLAGTWKGDYSIKSLSHVHLLSLSFGKEGQFQSGTIRDGENKYTITELSLIKMDSKTIEASLKESRGISATIHATFTSNKHGMIGSWKDDWGYTGVFSISKKR